MSGAEAGRIDWPGLMARALRAGLRPAEFWALTPREAALTLGLSAGPGPLTRDGLAALMSRHPDEPPTTKERHDG
ncbi:MAG: phage tail assembly chaperone [Paracoccaceae bacterium]